MKRIYFISLILLTVLCVYPDRKISTKQDILNREYLMEVDENITSTIDLLAAFNNTLKQMPEDIEGSLLFSNFLMEMTMECGSMRKSISESRAIGSSETHLLIIQLISNLNPGIELKTSEIDEKEDILNKDKIAVQEKKMRFIVVELQKRIISEEKGIIKSKTFNKHFFNLHTQHYVFQLLLDFMEPSEKLSRENRNFLLSIARTLDNLMLGEKK